MEEREGDALVYILNTSDTLNEARRREAARGVTEGDREAGEGEKERRGTEAHFRTYFWPTIIDRRPGRGSPACYCPTVPVVSS